MIGVRGWLGWALFGEAGLRWGWRVLGFASGAVLSMALGFWLADQLHASKRLRIAYARPLLPIVTVAPLLLFATAVAIVDVAVLGDGRGEGWHRWTEWLGGLVAGGALVVLTVLAIVCSASVDHLALLEPAPVAALVPLWLLAFVLVAAAEEVLFRGYGFQWLCGGLGDLASAWVGTAFSGVAVWCTRGMLTVASSLAFAAVHLGNPHVTNLGAVNTAVAGLWLAVAVFRTRTLWLACGLHAGWNICQAMVLGMPVSGLGSTGEGTAIPSLLVVRLAGPDGITGGGYGVEGSWLCTGVLLLGVLWSARWPRGRQRSNAERPAGETSSAAGRFADGA